MCEKSWCVKLCQVSLSWWRVSCMLTSLLTVWRFHLEWFLHGYSRCSSDDAFLFFEDPFLVVYL